MVLNILCHYLNPQKGFFFIIVGDDGSSLAKMNIAIFIGKDNSFVGGNDSFHLPLLLITLHFGVDGGLFPHLFSLSFV